MHTRHCFVFILLIVLIFQWKPAHTAEVTLNPSLNFRGEYNDNIDFSRSNRLDDYVGIISPGLTFGYATERGNVEAKAIVDVIRYYDYTERNYERQNYGLGVSYLLFERLSFKANGSYIKDITLDTQLEETGIVVKRSDRERYNAGGGFSYQMSELSAIGINYSYTEIDYKLPIYVDSRRHGGSLSYSYTFNNNLDVFRIGPYYRNIDSDDQKTDIYGFGLGIDHKFTETFSADVNASARYSETEQTAGKSDSNWGWSAAITLNKSWQTASAHLGYSRYLNPTTEGDIIEVDRFFLTLNKMLTKRFRLSLGGSIYFTKSQEEPRTTDTRYYSVTPSLEYMITENLSLALAYNYSNQYDETLINDKDVDRNRVWLSLNFNYPQKW